MKAYPHQLSPEQIKEAEAWSEIDGDLAGLPKERADAILQSRLGSVAADTPRAERWHIPDGIDMIADIPYLPDGGYDKAAGQCRGHMLDVYLPHDAVLRGGHTMPVYIDIHGGGFTYGYKELNRHFNVHLAEQGFVVFSLSYRPAPQTDLKGQLADIQAALCWIRDHIGDYPADPNAFFLTGDSAGGALTMLTLAVESNAEAAAAFGIGKPSGIHFAGATPVCGIYSLAAPEAVASGIDVSSADVSADVSAGIQAGISYDAALHYSLVNMLGEEFFAGLEDAQRFMSVEGLVNNVDLPPLFIVTCSDDFLEADNLALATALSRKGADFELYDPKVRRHDALGHVFVIGMPWLDESVEAFKRIRGFSYARC